MAVRLRNLYLGMTSLVAEYRPEAVAMEELYSHYAHPRTAILMGHARGVLNLAASMQEIDVFDYAATAVKASLTGNGRAPKAQMQRAIRHALKLKQDPEPPDVADALAVAFCHLSRVSGRSLESKILPLFYRVGLVTRSRTVFAECPKAR